MPDEVSFLGIAGTSDLIYDYFPFKLCLYMNILIIVVKLFVSVCITKAEANQR